MLLRYRYLQPLERRYQPAGGTSDPPAFVLAYAGSIPAREESPTEEVLERLWDRHSSELRPTGRGSRPASTGDVLDLGERGIWQAIPLGFRPLAPGDLKVEEAA